MLRWKAAAAAALGWVACELYHRMRRRQPRRTISGALGAARMQSRRIITGHDAAGRSVVVYDGPGNHASMSCGVR